MALLKIFSLVFSPMIVFVALLFISGRYSKASNKLDQWIPTQGLFEHLDSSVSIDRFLLNRLADVSILVSSSYLMIYFLFYAELNGWAADASRAFSVIFGLAGIFIGAGLTMGGETIRKINDKLSTWVSTERLFRPLDKIESIDDWFNRHNILMGIFLLFACLLINIKIWLAF